MANGSSLTSVEKEILFELQAIAHTVQKIDAKLDELLRTTSSHSSGSVLDQQRRLLESLRVWKELGVSYRAAAAEIAHNEARQREEQS